MKKKLLRFVFTLLLLLLFGTVLSEASETTSLGGYTVESYEINMVVNEDNSFDITENITVNFYEERHRNI